MEIYLGIYIRAVRKSVEQTVTELTCPRGHYVRRGEIFCSICGSELFYKEQISNEQLNFYSMISDGIISEEYEDDFLSVDSKDVKADILIPNSYTTTYGEDIDEEGEYPAGGYVAFSDFKKEFKNIIEIITPHYEKVTYDYGVVVRYD